MRRRLPSACRAARRSAPRSRRSPRAAAPWPRNRACSRRCGACARAGSRPVRSRAIRAARSPTVSTRRLARSSRPSPATFRHTELDVEANRRQLELLCERVEKLASREPVGAGAASPVATLASQLREALAANTIGGRVDEESRWKNSEYEVRGAQDAWRQVGFVPEADAVPLSCAVPARLSAVLRPAPPDVRAAGWRRTSPSPAELIHRGRTRCRARPVCRTRSWSRTSVCFPESFSCFQAASHRNG